MNISLLEELCKKHGRIVFENFKSSVENNPFGKINEDIVSNCLEFEINQEFGRTVLKEWIKTNNLNSKVQIDVVTGIINNYKKTIINTSLSWVKKKYLIVL